MQQVNVAVAVAGFLGWFGPVGVAAMYYALLAEEPTNDPAHCHAASFVVLISFMARGITSGPGLAAYRRRAARRSAAGDLAQSG